MSYPCYWTQETGQRLQKTYNLEWSGCLQDTDVKQFNKNEEIILLEYSKGGNIKSKQGKGHPTITMYWIEQQKSVVVKPGQKAK